MLSIAEYKNEQQVEKYFADHLSSGEYHTEQGKSLGTWHGVTTKHFGLRDGLDVTEDSFKKIVKGINPSTGKSFLIRKKSNRVIAREMLFSAPKSVSILAVTLQDERLKHAHARAVNAAFLELESLAQTRVRRGEYINFDGKRTTANILAARFVHETSRDLDPQLHTHNVVFNVTYDAAENRLKALDPHFIYNSTNYVTEVYRSELAREVRHLGYELEIGRYTWRIKGVTPEIEAIFSKRAAQIKKSVERLKQETGIDANNKGKALIAGLTRRAKNHDISEKDYLSSQLSQLSRDEKIALKKLISESKDRVKSGITDHFEPSFEAKKAINYAFEHVFERQSVVYKQDLLKEALRFAQGTALKSEIEAELKSDKYITRGQYIMTKEERLIELNILSIIKSGKRNSLPLVKDLKTENFGLDQDQNNAIQNIITAKDQFLYMRGMAGAGKTSTLNTLEKTVEAHAGHKKFIYLAPSSSATETLRNEGFKGAVTVQLFLQSDFIQKQSKGAFIVVDESGLLSTKQMEKLLEIAKKNETRVLLVGDTAQHNSVEGGDALRLIEDYSVIQKTELNKIKRQKHEMYREAVQDLGRGDVEKGWDKLNKMNSIIEANDLVRFNLIAKEFADAEEASKSTLVVCPTNDEIKKVTEKVRAELKERGVISENEQLITTHKSLNYTNVEKKQIQNYQSGLVLSFHKNNGSFKQGEVYQVIGVERGDIVAEGAKGITARINPEEFSKSYDVLLTEQNRFSKNDKILIKANYATSRENKVNNGLITKIKDFNLDGSITLENGKVLGSEFRQFSHGYAITSQSSQGKTADKVIVSAASRSGMAASRNQFYVSCSRGKHEITVYTDNKAKLKEAVTRSSSRPLVMEALVRDRIILKRIQNLGIGLERAVEKSRDRISKVMDRYIVRAKNKEKDQSISVATVMKHKKQVSRGLER